MQPNRLWEGWEGPSGRWLGCPPPQSFQRHAQGSVPPGVLQTPAAAALLPAASGVMSAETALCRGSHGRLGWGGRLTGRSPLPGSLSSPRRHGHLPMPSSAPVRSFRASAHLSSLSRYPACPSDEVLKKRWGMVTPPTLGSWRRVHAGNSWWPVMGGLGCEKSTSWGCWFQTPLCSLLQDRPPPAPAPACVLFPRLPLLSLGLGTLCRRHCLQVAWPGSRVYPAGRLAVLVLARALPFR